MEKEGAFSIRKSTKDDSSLVTSFYFCYCFVIVVEGLVEIVLIQELPLLSLSSS